MATLKQLATTKKVVMEEAFTKALNKLKTYIDAQDTAGSSAATDAVQAVSNRLDTLIGAQDGDLDKIINTFNEIKAFLADYSEDDTLKNLIDAAVSAATTAAATAAATAESNAKAYTDTKVAGEKTRAEGAEAELSARIQTIEDIEVMSSQQAENIFDGIFYPEPEPEQNGEQEEPEPENQEP